MPRSRRPRQPAPAPSQAIAAPGKTRETSDRTIANNRERPTLLTPVAEKIPEGKNHLQGRANAFKRRRGTTR